MSSAKRCDRCKEFYIPEAFINATDGNSWRYYVMKSNHPYTDLRIDLCPNCNRALVQWLGTEE